jgi:hypothetical protein
MKCEECGADAELELKEVQKGSSVPSVIGL